VLAEHKSGMYGGTGWRSSECEVSVKCNTSSTADLQNRWNCREYGTKKKEAALMSGRPENWSSGFGIRVFGY